MTVECEEYLGLLILYHVLEDREEQAWSLLDDHLAQCGYPLPLAVNLLLPLAQYLVKYSKNKQCSNIKVNNILSSIYNFDNTDCHHPPSA